MISNPAGLRTPPHGVGMAGERDNKKRCLQKSASIAFYCFWGMFDIKY